MQFFGIVNFKLLQSLRLNISYTYIPIYQCTPISFLSEMTETDLCISVLTIMNSYQRQLNIYLFCLVLFNGPLGQNLYTDHFHPVLYGALLFCGKHININNNIVHLFVPFLVCSFLNLSGTGELIFFIIMSNVLVKYS